MTTINGVGGASQFDSELYSAVSASAEGRIGLLALENQSLQKSADEERRAEARATFIDESKRQVEAMRDEASSIALGGWVQAGIGVAGGAAGVYGATVGSEEVRGQNATVASRTLGLVAEPTAKFVGEAPAADHRADQAEHSSQAGLAKDEMSSAAEHINAERDAQKQALAWLSSVLESGNRAKSAVLDNMG